MAVSFWLVTGTSKVFSMSGDKGRFCVISAVYNLNLGMKGPYLHETIASLKHPNRSGHRSRDRVPRCIN